MADTINEGQHAGEFIVSQANGGRSRDRVTFASGEVIKPGHVLGVVSTSGEYKEYNPSNTDGSETAVAVAYDHVDASGGAADGPAVTRDAEVSSGDLVWFSSATSAEKTTGKDELQSNAGIIAR